MKKTLLALTTFTVLLGCNSCTDGNYDLSNIDTNSRFNVSGLTVPMNMDPVKLDLMLDISDDSDIKTDGDGNYYFRKEGTFTSSAVNVAKISLAKPKVDIGGKMSIKISLDPDVMERMRQYAQNMTIGQLLQNPQLMQQIGITADMEILNVNFDSSQSANEITLNASNIDANVRSIETLGIDNTKLSIIVKVNGLQNAVENFAIQNLKIVMPRGLAVSTSAGTKYSSEQGVLTPVNDSYLLDNNFAADLSMTVSGINYAQFEEPGMKVFDPEQHTIRYKKLCSASGHAQLTIADLKKSAKYDDIIKLTQPEAVQYDCNISFEKDLSISSFKGDITYSMDDINVDPVVISSVPDILKESGTNIDLRNPQIYLSMRNHLNQYGIKVNSALEIKGNNTITAPLNINSTEHTNIVMSPLAEDLYHPQGYTHEEVKSLSTVVGSNDGQTFPEQLNIRVIKPQVPTTNLLKPLELGKDLQGVEGTWEFYTRLSLTDNTKIKYTKEWDDWNDKDLDGLTVNTARVNVTVKKDIAMDAESIEFILKGRKGELRGQTALSGDASQDIVLELKGTPVSEITGGKLNVHMKGLNRELNKNQQIEISNLKVRIDGYYDREL